MVGSGGSSGCGRGRNGGIRRGPGSPGSATSSRVSAARTTCPNRRERESLSGELYVWRGARDPMNNNYNRMAIDTITCAPGIFVAGTMREHAAARAK